LVVGLIGVMGLGGEEARERAVDALARLRDQVAEITAMQKKRAALRVDGVAADGTVEVTVDASGRLVRAEVDKSFLDDHDFEELGGCLVEAAQAAAGDAAGQVAEMMAPINERHRLLGSFSDLVEGLPDVGDLLPPGSEVLGVAGPRGEGSLVGGDDDGDVGAGFPTVTR
jgi:DNA-binding protein YbaB